MKKTFFIFTCTLLLYCTMPTTSLASAVENPAVVTAFLNRIGGDGAADRFVTIVDESISTGNEKFIITAQDGKPCIKGNTTLAVTTGINWYLNHYAHINIAWNNLTTDLVGASLPLPSTEESHTCTADYRYYLNYCTFSYSMSTWTWERWQQEIDWMALHGINMPLQIVGLDVVWKKLLTMPKYGYTSEEANEFIAGPCFQAWWGMNNLEGWGGPNPDWWYTRQAELAKNINDRMRELGMQPVLPGFSGMVPSNFTAKTSYATNAQGNWCGFTRPYILDPNSETFKTVAADYYATLKEVMGTSTYYSMDPFHEGANTSGIDVPSAYKAIADAMYAANEDIDEKWVIQYWQWSSAQYNVLNQVAKGDLIVLDLFSDGHTHFGSYNNHDAVYCMLPNFGGRTGFMGRFDGVLDGYFSNKAQYSNIKGIGATPEAIESMPVLYDLLFELPWHQSKPDRSTWIKEYATNRYGTESATAQEAWEKLRTSALNCQTALQGPHEAVMCARPSLTVNAVSSWGGTEIFYDAQDVADAAHKLLEAGLSGENYSYDLTDISRQTLTDYAYYLLQSINAANSSGNEEAFNQRRDTYLQLISDLDVLLNTNKNFMLGRWTQMARDIADEAAGTTNADKEWLEKNNARTLITTWGDRNQANSGGLRDYSYRQWGGMLKDFYLPRWEKFFANMSASNDWFSMEWDWAHNNTILYPTTPTGNTSEVAREILGKYFLTFKKTDGSTFYIYRAMETNKLGAITEEAARGIEYQCPVTLPAGTVASISIDYNNDGNFGEGETTEGTTATIPADAATGNIKAQLALPDGTVFNYTLILKDNITTPRTVSVSCADATQGSVAIVGAQGTSVTTTDYVTIQATPNSNYDFSGWTDSEGKTVSTDNPYTYYGKEAANFTANFIINKWGAPTEDRSDWSDIVGYNQYIRNITLTQNNTTSTLYEASECPAQLFNTVGQRITAAPGGSFTLNWEDAGGLQYTYLSAYIDLDNDGDFDMDDELLAVKGAHSSTSSAPCCGPLQILLPYEMPLGITHIRLRFDGAWKEGYDSTTGAYPAQNTANRMVYDIIVDVQEYAPYACNITVKSSDDKRGTADTNGQTNPYTYGIGESIILRATPGDNYVLKNWKDQHGRTLPTQWMNENAITFKGFDNAVITAVFEPAASLTYGDWTFSYEEVADGAAITGIEKEGTAVLDLTGENSLGLPLYAINADVFKGNEPLTSVSLPSSLISLNGTMYGAEFTGSGIQGALLSPAPDMPDDKPWTLKMQVDNGGTSFNTWGSCLLATGTNPFGDSYDNGFQLYLAAANTLTVKVGWSENRFSANLGQSFSIEVEYNGKGQLTVTTISENGAKETKTLQQQLNPISNFSTALNSGKNFTVSVFSPDTPSSPFRGCTSLTDIQVQEGNTSFSSITGMLYDANGSQLLSYPEGRLYTRTFTLKNASDGKYVEATPHADTNGLFTATDYNNAERRVAMTDQLTPTTFVRLYKGESKNEIIHLNSKGYFGGKSNSGGEGQQIEVLSNPIWAGDYTLDILQDFDNTLAATISLQANGYYLNSTGEAFALTGTSPSQSTASQWVLQEVKSVPVAVTSQLWTAACFPVPVLVPEETEGIIYKAESIEGDYITLTSITPGTVLKAGEGILVQTDAEKSIAFPISTDNEGTSLSGNLLSGATAQRSGFTPETFYGLGNKDKGIGFYISVGTIVPANKSYLLKNVVGSMGISALRFRFGNLEGINTIETEDAPQAETYYDLRGNRVLYPSRGIYVTSSGKKILIP